MTPVPHLNGVPNPTKHGLQWVCRWDVIRISDPLAVVGDHQRWVRHLLALWSTTRDSG